MCYTTTTLSMSVDCLPTDVHITSIKHLYNTLSDDHREDETNLALQTKVNRIQTDRIRKLFKPC
jgi:hypothetical protein